MEYDPRKDPKFKKFMDRVLATDVGVEPEVAERQVLIEISNSVPVPGTESMIQTLGRLRSNFVIISLIHPEEAGRGVRKAALDVLNSVRHQPEVWQFLLGNPYFFTEIDRQILQDWPR